MNKTNSGSSYLSQFLTNYGGERDFMFAGPKLWNKTSPFLETIHPVIIFYIMG